MASRAQWQLIPILLAIWAAPIGAQEAQQDAVRGQVANPHGNLTLACEGCHTTTSWRPVRKVMEFDHNAQTSFALRGMHQSVPCTGCHVDLVFSKAPTQCSECHADLHRRQFGANCQQCHSVQGWNVQVSAIQDHNNRFPLLGAHAAVICEQCHRGAASGVFTGLSTQCVSCHQRDFQTATPLNHVAAGLPTTCEACHTMNSWQAGTRFDHAQFAHFALTGGHAGLQCQQCHVGNRYAGTPTACIGCHMNDYVTAKAPDHVAANFPQDCSGCHTTATWLNATFDHNTATSFPLTGAHVNVACAQCHVGGKFAGTPTACSGCHLQDYSNTTNPNHRAANLPTTCETCHTTATWQSVTQFDHAITGFALSGAHTAVQCAQCHNAQFGNYSITSGACALCHVTDYNGANNPPHKAANFPLTCDTCHTMVAGWGGATFDHASTGFTLTGAHTSLQCTQCHTAQFGNYSITNGACWNCHQTDYNSTTNPNHRAGNLPQDCSLCHTTVAGWGGAQFNHANTGFALLGAHNALACTSCHNPTYGNYSITNADCMNCHRTDYNGATNPDHKAANFPGNCDGCHNMNNWLGATFNHASTGFALTGAHTTVQCSSCHTAQFGSYSITSGACANCHMTDYNGTTNPNHGMAGFPTTCDTCHTTVAGWGGATFNHASTGFTLTGAHTSLQCTQCHNTQFGNYSITSVACANCHMTDYNNTTNPPHKAANFPVTCDGCHTTVAGWGGATFNHATTGFALTGFHTTMQCAQCHVNNNYNITSAACWNCHQSDYNGTTNPPHKAANFPQDCSGCHTTTDWTGATFNHATTGFTLVGMHASQQCAACHVNNNYTLNSAACWNCHQTDYNNATNPPHQTAGFPQDCTICHGTSITNWTSATFDHSTTGFTLTGAHTSLQCAQCHTNNNYSLTATNTACYGCHQADYNGTTNPPHKAQGFPQDCSGCHTTTNWLGATFNHATTGFALTGYHATMQCAQCHVNNNYSLSSAACWNCHQADYNGTTSPAHLAAGFPQDCSMCHSTTDWSGATFAHPTTPLALTGYHATMLTNNQCNLCHLGVAPYTNTTTVCYNCHTADWSGTANPGHAAANKVQPTTFPTTCDSCHTFIDWTGAKYTAHDTMSPGFAIYSGRHNGLWQNCTDCHVNSTDYTNGPSLSCMTGSCHPASSVDNVGSHQSYITKYGLTVFHQGSSCYACHTRV